MRLPSHLVLPASLLLMGLLPGDGGCSGTAGLPAVRDTLEGINEVTRILRNHYRGIDRMGEPRGRGPGPRQDRLCEGGDDSVCHGGDPDRGLCNQNVPCHPTEEFLLEGLREEATQYPQSGFIQGQAVYALTKFGRVQEAQELVDGCRAEGWWCEALQAYVLYSYAPMEEVEARFRSALEKAPREVKCTWEDALWLLGDWDQRVSGRENVPEVWRSTEDWGCDRRLAVSDTLFWLGDPLFSREGNDRWTVHVARAMAAHLYRELRETVRGRPFPEEEKARDWAMRIRRGPWDSYRFPGAGRGADVWTSEEAARYHFIPEVTPDDLSDPVWRLDGDILKEGYTPEYGPLFIIPGQVARFRSDGELRVAAAAGLRGTRLDRALDLMGHLILSDGPQRVSDRADQAFRQERPVLVGEAPPEHYVLSLEVETDLGIGLHRELVTPLAMHGPELSDLVLFEAVPGQEPASLEEIGSRMMGSTALEEMDEVGVFWEVYGVPEGEELAFDLTLERADGGLVDRLRGLFPGGEREGRGRVTWTEPALGLTHPRGITLSVTGLQPGRYALVLRARWNGVAELERRRDLRIRER